MTESFNILEGFFNCMVLDSQPTKSVPRRVRLVIERNINELWPKRNPRDLRQVGIGARLDSNLPAMSRARVWTNSITVAEHVQPEAIAREGPSHSEELSHLL